MKKSIPNFTHTNLGLENRVLKIEKEVYKESAKENGIDIDRDVNFDKRLEREEWVENNAKIKASMAEKLTHVTEYCGKHQTYGDKIHRTY